MADQQIPAVGLMVEASALRPLVEAVVREALLRIEAERQATADPDRLCYSEEEAARLLGLRPHVLRDERRRGRIVASSIVGRRTRYLRADLIGYMADRRKPAVGAA